MRETGDFRVVEIIREQETLIPPVGCDVGRLPIEIDRVFGVDFELLGNSGRELKKFWPYPGHVGDADVRVRQELKSRSALTIAVEREPIRVRFLRGHGNRAR